MEQESYVDLGRLLAIMRRRWLIVVFVPLAAVAVAVGFSAAQEKQYDATAILLTGQGEGIADIQQIAAVNQATQSLARMAGNRVVMEQTIERREVPDIDAVTMERGVSVSVPANTQQIELTVRNADPELAALYANSISETFTELVDERAVGESKLSATLWQPAIVPAAAATPNIPLNAMIALVLGGLLGIALAVVRDRLDATWRSEEEIEAALGVPVLAIIPSIEARSARERLYA